MLIVHESMSSKMHDAIMLQIRASRRRSIGLKIKGLHPSFCTRSNGHDCVCLSSSEEQPLQVETLISHSSNIRQGPHQLVGRERSLRHVSTKPRSVLTPP